jgi:hypothetical protein
MQLKKMFITKGMNEFAFYFILCVLFVFLLFIMFDMLSFYFAYGVQEKSLFFGRQFDISSNNGTSELPQIAVQGNNIYVVWQDNTPGNYDIFFTHSSDNGNSFAPVLNLSNNSGTSELPQIAVQGNNIYVVWQDNTPGNYDIFLQRTLSNGTKFKYRNLSNNNGTSELPQLSVSSNNIYVIWKDNNDTGVHKMFFKHGQKDNATGKIEYSNSYSLNHSGEPAQAKIVTGSEYFYGVWTTYLNKKDVSALEFYPFRLFGDNSGNSIPLTRLSLNESVSNPDIATRDDDAFLVWESTEAGNRDIFFKKLSRNFFERNN